MMLRLLVLLLVLANAAYYAWSRQLLAPVGLAPTQQAEPQRVGQQVKPEAVRLLPGDEARRIEIAAAPRPTECVQAGLFTDPEADSLKSALEGWPPGSWSLEAATEPARWIVYMGKYPDAGSLEKKKAELRGLNVSFEPLANPSMEPGISLGGYPTEAAAKQQMEALAQKGVRTAKVVQERAEARGQSLKFPAIDDTLRPKLDDLKTALNGKPLKACR
ncbi:SPOR domain-containing protein [Ramlibacter sp. PS4R-6]|uniref:SPOR domain-containing protein n=1 Tax=Ramlibacter sp. PS4R-6 TaxID=3133438 RepID=UPI0030B11AE4